MTNTRYNLSPEYTEALKAHDAAIKAYHGARDAYLSGGIDDATFLAARAQFDEATRQFDAAHAVEAGI